MAPNDRRGFLVGLAVTVGLVLLDVSIGSHASITSSYVLGAIVAGVLAGFRAALIVGVISMTLAILSGAWNHDFGDAAYFARLFVALLGNFFALEAGRLRDRNVAQLGRQALLVAVADLPQPGSTLEATVARVTGLLVPEHAGFAAVEAARDGETIRLAARGTEPVDPIALVATPLRARGHAIGTLLVGGREFGADGRDFMRVLAGRVALALDNAGLSQELLTVEQQLEAILANLGEAVTVQDRTGQLVYANQAAADLLGAESVAELSTRRRESSPRASCPTTPTGPRWTSTSCRVASCSRAAKRSRCRARGRPRDRGRALAGHQGDAGARAGRRGGAGRQRDRGHHRRQAGGAVAAAARRCERCALVLTRLRAHASAGRRPGRAALADWCSVSMPRGDVLEPVAVAHSRRRDGRLRARLPAR